MLLDLQKASNMGGLEVAVTKTPSLFRQNFKVAIQQSRIQTDPTPFPPNSLFRTDYSRKFKIFSRKSTWAFPTSSPTHLHIFNELVNKCWIINLKFQVTVNHWNDRAFKRFGVAKNCEGSGGPATWVSIHGEWWVMIVRWVMPVRFPGSFKVCC